MAFFKVKSLDIKNKKSWITVKIYVQLAADL